MACPVCGRRVEVRRVASDRERTRLATTHLADHDLPDVEASVYAAVMAGEDRATGGLGEGTVGGAILSRSGVWDGDRTGGDL